MARFGHASVSRMGLSLLQVRRRINSAPRIRHDNGENDSATNRHTRAINPRRHPHGWLAMLALLVLGAPLAATAATLLGATMGTTYRLILPSLASPDTRLKTRVDGLLARINGQMSTYQADSELSRLNASPSGEWLAVSADLFEVLKAAHAVSVASDGAFDITVGPLVDLWGFGPSPQLARPPQPDALAAARARVGYRQLELADGPPRVRKARADLALDLSAIAKGYAVDQVAALLENAGLHDYLIDIGGELRVAGQRRPGQAWQVGVALPSAEREGLERVLPLTNNALATSGDYRNYFDYGGRRYSHEIDPATGQPLQHALASVSVLHASCMWADAYATALLVMGPQRGLALATRQHLAALFLVRTPAGFTAYHTPGFPPPR